jgi:16S rRNA (guanine527-N7)-methyltransferase
MHCVVDTARIAELLRPFLSSPLTSLQLDQISTYIDLLLRWNARVNLTAVRTPRDIVTRHFGESLFAACHLLPSAAETPLRDTPRQTTQRSVPQVRVRSLDATLGSSTTEPTEETISAGIGPAHGGHTSSVPSHLVDIGSGAGFPGLPMKIWSPQTRVTLIESNHKKVAFLRELIRALTLTGIDVFPARAETFFPATATVVTLRAVERFPETLPTALALLAPTARLALLITRPQFPLAQNLTPTLHWLPPLPIPLSENRLLAIGVR